MFKAYASHPNMLGNAQRSLDILRPAFTLCSFMSDGFVDGSGLIGNHAT